MTPDSATKAQADSQRKSTEEKLGKIVQAKQGAIEKEIDLTEKTLTLSIPFIALPALTGRLHVQRGNCNVREPERNSILLPELAPRLKPSVVTVSEPEKGIHRLEGEHLQAVDKIRLEGNGRVIMIDAWHGLNSVDFAPKYNEQPLDAGTYRISVVIGTMTIDVQMADSNKKLIPAVIKIEPKKSSDSTTPGEEHNGSGTDGKSNINVDLNLAMKGTATAEKKAGKNKGPESPAPGSQGSPAQNKNNKSNQPL